MSEPEPEPAEAAGDTTVGAWLDINPSAAASEEPPSEVPEPVDEAPKPDPTSSLWGRIKRALAAKA